MLISIIVCRFRSRVPVSLSVPHEPAPTPRPDAAATAGGGAEVAAPMLRQDEGGGAVDPAGGTAKMDRVNKLLSFVADRDAKTVQRACAGLVGACLIRRIVSQSLSV